MMNVFLDTNVIIDILQKREGYQIELNLLQLSSENRIQLFASSLTFVNCIYILRKYLGYERVFESVKELRQLIHISPMGEIEFDQAFQSISPDAEDTLQYYSALGSECKVIITNNKKHFPQTGEVPVMTASEFFNQFFTLQ
ncbi:MAG: PIN domain-containing protein [Prevotella sp.]|nr:PIN domain-containing protein [Prevotella sp.]